MKRFVDPLFCPRFEAPEPVDRRMEDAFARSLQTGYMTGFICESYNKVRRIGFVPLQPRNKRHDANGFCTSSKRGLKSFHASRKSGSADPFMPLHLPDLPGKSGKCQEDPRQGTVATFRN